MPLATALASAEKIRTLMDVRRDVRIPGHKNANTGRRVLG
jgi:hypothetical protein